MTEYAYEKIIPPDMISDIIQIGQSTSDGAFALGDIANKCILFNKLAGNDVTQDLVYRAVGSFCGKKGRTVRYYAEVADRFPAYIRQEYQPLSFSHFAFAMKYTNWQEILTYAMDNMDERGRPASLDHIVAVFAYEDREVSTNSEIETMVDNLRKAIYKLPMPGEVRRLVMDALQRIVEAVKMVEVH